jgi:hypothetical protein
MMKEACFLNYDEDPHLRLKIVSVFQILPESIVAISLFYQLEIFSGCFFSVLKPLLAFLLHQYELSERSARYKILNTTEHER